MIVQLQKVIGNILINLDFVFQILAQLKVANLIIYALLVLLQLSQVGNHKLQRPLLLFWMNCVGAKCFKHTAEVLVRLDWLTTR